MHVPDWLVDWSLHVPPHHAQLFAPPSLELQFSFSSADLQHSFCLHFLDPTFRGREGAWSGLLGVEGMGCGLGGGVFRQSELMMYVL